jgi:hypothetical protein
MGWNLCSELEEVRKPTLELCRHLVLRLERGRVHDPLHLATASVADRKRVGVVEEFNHA